MAEAHIFRTDYDYAGSKYEVIDNISGIKLYSDENIKILYSPKGHNFTLRLSEKPLDDFIASILVPFYNEQRKIFENLIKENLLILYSDDILTLSKAEYVIRKKIEGLKKLEYVGTYFTRAGNIINFLRKA